MSGLDHAHAAVEQAGNAKAALKLFETILQGELAAARARLDTVVAEEPWAADKVRALSGALNVTTAVYRRLLAIANGEDAARGQVAHLNNIAKMSPERRRILGI